MRILPLLLMLFLSLFAFNAKVMAEDAPPATPGVTAAAPAAPVPAQSAPAAAQPAPVARKEEDETAPANGGWSLKNLGAYLKSKGTLADAAAEKDRQIAALTERITALESGAELKAARAEAAAYRKDLEAFAHYAQTHGLLKEDGTAARIPAPQTAAGQAAGAAVAAGVSTQLATLGVPVASMPAAAGTGGKAASLAEVEEQLKACKTPAERQRILSENRALIMRSN